MTAPFHVLRFKAAAAALALTALASGGAVAKNHDCQSFKLPGAASVLHDRAPSPVARAN